MRVIIIDDFIFFSDEELEIHGCVRNDQTVYIGGKEYWLKGSNGNGYYVLEK